MRFWAGQLLLLTAVAVSAQQRPLAVRVVEVPAHLDDEQLVDEEGASAAGQLQRLRGLSDVTAWPGRRLEYAIDPHAFSAPVQHYQVDSLPSWLTFDSRTSVFSGVPLESEAGRYLVSVLAEAQQDSSQCRDEFLVNVLQPSTTELYGPSSSVVVCTGGQSPLLVSVYFSVDPINLTALQRLQLISALAAGLGLSADSLLIRADSAADVKHRQLVAGPGYKGDPNNDHTAVTWQVGCSATVDGALVERVARDVSEQLELDGGTAGWQLHQQLLGRRSKRQVEDGSGRTVDDYDNDYYYDEEYDEDDQYDDGPQERVVPGDEWIVSGSGDGLQPPGVTPVYTRSHVSVPDIHDISTPLPTPVVSTSYTPDNSDIVVSPSATVVSTSPIDTVQLQSSIQLTVSSVEATSGLPELVSTTPPLYATPPSTTTPPTTAALPATTPPTTTAPPATSAVPADEQLENQPPQLKRRMQKLSLVAGREFELTVPTGTFYDQETGDTRRLVLYMRSTDGQPINTNDWIQFDPIQQRIYALPKEEDIGEYKYTLTASDEQGARASDTVHVSVRQYQQWRAVNHRFRIDVKLTDHKAFPVLIDWELLLMRKLARLLDQDSTESIMVHGIHKTSGHPISFSWFNDTLSTHSCDRDGLDRILKKLVDTDGEPTAELRRVLAPEFTVKQLKVLLVHACKMAVVPSLPDPPSPAPDANQPPFRRRAVDLIRARAGRLLRFQVPEDTFHDNDDGGTRDLKLRLLTSDRLPVSADNWLQFEPKNQEFVGIPLDEHAGRSHYHLECTDSGGLTVSDSIELVVQARAATEDFNVEFQVTLDNDYDRFVRDSLQRTRLLERLGSVFATRQLDTLVVHPVRRGSVVFSWHNDSLPADRCDDAQISALRHRLLDDDGQVTTRARTALAPEFALTAARLVPRGVCLSPGTPTARPPPLGPPSGRPAPGPPPPQGRGHEYLMTFIVPAVVIAAMLLLAGCVACALLRARRRRGKLTLTERGTYVSRGIPVIFADELEERLEKSAKTPVILHSERASPRPPNYGRDPSASPMLDPRGEANTDESPYQRPPPFASAPEAMQPMGRKSMSNYRQPPPYVPP